ncbi:MAG: aldehyde dehydrogenase [Burkholderiales bacterium]|nr:aldehyde dehydrogenase [Burkholderiales bacterium]
MSNLLKRRAVVRQLLRDRGEMLVVGGLGAPAWDITAAGDHDNNFPLWGAMGGAAMIGLGLALAQPNRRVMVITGDGEMLMGIGSLATIAAQRPRNLAIVVLDNERYGETGQQLTHTGLGTDLSGMARAAGITHAVLVRKPRELADFQAIAAKGSGPAFAQVKVDPEKLPLVLPPREASYLKNRFRLSVLGKTALHD